VTVPAAVPVPGAAAHHVGPRRRQLADHCVPDSLVMVVTITPIEGCRCHNHHKRGLAVAADAAAVNTIYRGCMGKLLLIVLAAIAAFMILSIVVSALHFIFWVAVVALIVVVGMRLTGGARRRSRQ
jgi:uncharacterized protein YacL